MPVIDCIDIDAQEAKKVAIQPEFSTVKVNLSKTLSKIQTQIKGKIAVSEGEIAKILSVDATAVCSPSEVFVGEVRYCGRVNFSVIYLDKDGKNRNTQTSVEFSGKAENEDIKANSRARIVCSLLDCETIAVGDDEISLGAVVEVDITVFAEAEVSYLAGADGLYYEKGLLEYCKTCCSGKAVGESETEIAVKMEQILCYNHNICISNAICGVDYIKIIGFIKTRIVGQDENGLISCQEITTPINDEISALNATVGDIATVWASVSTTERADDSENGKKVELNYTISYEYSVCTNSSVETITNVFSPCCELSAQKQDFLVCYNRNPICITERAEGSVILPDDTPIIDNILGVASEKIAITNIIANDGEVVVEGILSASVVYYSAEPGIENTATAELPFALSLRADEVKTGDKVCATATIKDMSVRLRRGNELDLRAEIALCLSSYSQVERTVIVSVVEGENLPIPTCAFGVHIAREGESLWDCCKALCVTPETLIAQNPNCNKKTFDGGEKIVIYRKALS